MKKQCTATLLIAWLFVCISCSNNNPAPPAATAPEKENASAEMKPGKVQTDAGVIKLTATGHQFYEAQASKDTPGKLIWVNYPAADLFDESGKKVGTHYKGPTWEYEDGSKVLGKKLAEADAPDHTGVKWLILDTVKNEGKGRFTAVERILRVETHGGKGPKEPPTDADIYAKRIDSVAYSATYYFFLKKPE